MKTNKVGNNAFRMNKTILTAMTLLILLQTGCSKTPLKQMNISTLRSLMSLTSGRASIPGGSSSSGDSGSIQAPCADDFAVPTGMGVAAPKLCIKDLDILQVGPIRLTYSEYTDGGFYIPFFNATLSYLNANELEWKDGSDTLSFYHKATHPAGFFYPDPLNGSHIEVVGGIANLIQHPSKIEFLTQGGNFAFNSIYQRIGDSSSPWKQTIKVTRNVERNLLTVENQFGHTHRLIYNQGKVERIEGPQSDNFIFDIKFNSKNQITEYSYWGPLGDKLTTVIVYINDRLSLIRPPNYSYKSIKWLRGPNGAVSSVEAYNLTGAKVASRVYSSCSNILIKYSEAFGKTVSFAFKQFGTHLRLNKLSSTENPRTQIYNWDPSGRLLIEAVDSKGIGSKVVHYNGTNAPMTVRSSKTNKEVFSSTLAYPPEQSLLFASVKTFGSPLVTVTYQNLAPVSVSSNGQTTVISRSQNSGVYSTSVQGDGIAGGIVSSAVSEDGLPLRSSSFGYSSEMNWNSGILNGFSDTLSGSSSQILTNDFKTMGINSSPVGPASSFSYAGNGQLESFNRGIVSESYIYNKFGEIESIVSSLGGNTTNLSVSSDPSGMIQSTLIDGVKVSTTQVFPLKDPVPPQCSSPDQ